jgi:hypothetical protein
MNPNEKTPKKTPKFFCEKCRFISSNKKDYTRHLSTDKHKILTNPNKKPQKTPYDNQCYFCICGKKYKHISSLCAHKKKCNYKNENSETIEACENKEKNENDKELIKILIKENNEMKNLILDVCKNKANINIINTNNSKTFNLNLFLNEQCKDAMNIMDFVESLKIQFSDLENVGKLGYIEGISNIIVKNLKALDIHKRPIHCSDSKRETIYVKDENKWEKENQEKNKLRKAIKYIAHKNSKMLHLFKEKYPDCIYSDSKKSDQYNKLIIETMGGQGNNETEKEDKIIKNIAKEIVINKF